jgi:hypothetical protein
MRVDGWTELTVAKVVAGLPTDMGNLYRSWVEGNPSKAGRLAEIVAETVVAFRDAVETQQEVVMDEDATMIPATGYRHAFNLVVFNLGMEMGVQFAPEVYSLFVQANIWLRMVATGKMRPVRWRTATGRPRYRRRRRR